MRTSLLHGLESFKISLFQINILIVDMIKKTLRDCLFRLSLAIALVGMSGIAAAQYRTITGKVTSALDGEELVGATTLSKGTTNGVWTDVEGNYSIAISDEDSVLVFSYVGFSQMEITIGNRTVIDVTLFLDEEFLEEFVVVGYGVQRKSDVTGSLVSVESQDLVKQTSFDVIQGLQGKVAGLQVVNSNEPGGIPQVRIRGVGTVLGGANPIYVVDGVITSSIVSINSHDIESITILKDASATSIYGVRGANGVVLVTTKSGDGNSRRVSYSGSSGIRKAINEVQLADSRLYADYTNRAQQRVGLSAPFLDISKTWYRDGGEYNTNWFNEITRDAFFQSHNISISGGSEKSSNYLGLSYLFEEGILKRNSAERATVRLNNKLSISDKLRVASNINYSFSNTIGALASGAGVSRNTVSRAFSTAYVQAPNIPAFDSNGRYGFSGSINNVGNPVAMLDFNNDKYWNNRLQGNFSVEFDFLEKFSWSTSLAYNLDLTRDRSYTPKFEIDPVKQFTEQSRLGISRNLYTFWNINNLLTYENIVGKHSISILAGFISEETKIDGFWASRTNVPNIERLWYLGVGDVTSAENGQFADQSTRISYVARANYSFDDKYLFTGTLRNEGSSKFPKEERFGLFPAIGLGWILSNETFLYGVEWLHNLKLRGSWGRIGNDQIPSNEFALTIGSSEELGAVFGNSQEFQNGAAVTQLKDEQLTWETVESWNLGIDFSFFDGVLSGEVDYYDRITSDVLVNKPIGAASGDVDLITNAGQIRNNGLELVLGYSNKDRGTFKHSLTGTLTLNNNNVEKLSAGSHINGGDLSNGRLVTRTDEGQEVGSFWVFKTNGLYNDQAEINAGPDPNARPGDLRRVDVNGDGRIDDGDRVFMGSFSPKTYFGFSWSMEYKGFDLSVDTYGNLGNKVFNGLKYRRFGGENITSDLDGFWTPENRSTHIPGASNDIPEPSDFYVEEGDFFRINNITLGYTFSRDATQVRLFGRVQNPIMWQKYSGYTPELPRGVLDSGIELDIYPSVATYTLGVSVDFN